MNCHYTFSSISNGQYDVTIDLQGWMCAEQRTTLQKNIYDIGQKDPFFQSICSMNGSILSHKSESLFPLDTNCDPNKKKVLIILGNPATHSVANGMFFFSMGKPGAEETHTFWKKLEKPGLIQKVRRSTLKEESETRKDMIINGTLSNVYLFGFTTFYSFPTPVEGDFKDVAGVRRLFKPVMKRIRDMEYDRLNNYKSQFQFVRNALWVFHERTSQCCAEKKFHDTFKRWPARGKNSSGEYLSKILYNQNLGSIVAS